MDMKNVEDFYPLSPMQQGMLFHSLLTPESGVYFEQLSCTIKGALNIEAFERAWNMVVNRHPILRTAFVGEGLKEPVQVVYRKVQLPFEKQNWQNLSADEQEQRLKIFLSEDKQRGFKFLEAPLIRCAIFETGQDLYQFVWSHHHILLDGWCLPIILNEVFTYYDAYSRGQELHLEMTRPYRDYIIWLKQQDLSRAEAFWRRTLKGFTAPTVLLPNYHSKTSPHEICSLEIHLSERTTASLQQLSRKHQLTLNTLVQAAWAILLGRYSGETDVVFGATVSGRPPDMAGAEQMIGLFINTLPVRVQTASHGSLISWLKQLQEQQLEQRQYEYSSLIQIQQWSDIPRGLPLFETILVFENYPIDSAMAEQQGIQLKIENIHSEEQTNYPITVVAGPGRELMIRILYESSRIDDDFVLRMLNHLQIILEQFVTNPSQRVQDINILTEAEQRLLLVEWNDTGADYPHDQCIHHLFESTVDQNPEAIAVIFEQQQLTYGELDQRANQLVHYLKQLGVGPEKIVAICVKRSLEMIVSILGVLKAGGAYLPIDPDYPEERMTYMLNDSAALVLITQKDLVKKFTNPAAQIVLIHDDWHNIAKESTQRPASEVIPENLAYVIYTSGSTGKPKGTLLQHRGLVNYITANINQLGITNEDRILQFAAFGFDASVLEIFTALVSGATLSLTRRETLLSSADLIQYLQKETITATLLPPSLLAILPVANLPDLKTLLSGGEKCTKEIVEKWAPGRNFYNAYGPTEATVAPTIYHIKSISNISTNVPIGHPIANTSIYLLDQFLQPVPPGIAGELYIGGIGLARGYHNRPDLTSEKFVPNPFGTEPGERLYKTGDLARYRSDGNLEFLGRIDYQVKVNGFRIELEEIESVMDQHPAVSEVAVIVRDSDRGSGDKRLVAYFVAKTERKVTIGELRDFLKNKLPEYMVPSTFVQLDTFPLTPNGKIDRKALPEPDQKRPDLAKPYVPPRDAWELGLVQIWEEVLNVQPIGVTDNFFELGGHSLIAVRLIAQVQQRLGRGLPLNALFQEPTIKNLARILRIEDGTTTNPTLVPLQPKGSKKPLFFVHPSGGSVHWYISLARYIGNDQPLYGIQAKGLNEGAEIHTTIQDMAAYYVNAIRDFQPEGPYYLGSWSLGVIVAFEMAQQLAAMGQEVAFLGLVDQGPHVPGAAPIDEAAYLMDAFGKHLPLSIEKLRQMELLEQIKYVYDLAIKTQWIRQDVTLAQFRHFIHILKTYTEAWRNYDVKNYPGKVTLFRAKNSHNGDGIEKDMGWAKLATDGVDIYDVPGDHISMMVEQAHVKVLAEKMKNCLENVQSNT